MANSYLVIPEAFGHSTCLACEECGALEFSLIWDAEPIAGPRKIEAVCCECLHRVLFALEYDPWAVPRIGG